MDRFIGRQAEMVELDHYLDSRRGHLLSVYGRRVGKTTLLIEWAKQTGLPPTCTGSPSERRPLPPGTA